jgi:DNA-binding beta-propeller fold protein YncE
MIRLLSLCTLLGFALLLGFGPPSAWGAPAYSHKWGTPGTGPEEFDNPRGIALDPNGNVYVADTSNDRILKFAPNGTQTGEWGGTGAGDGQFESPWDVAVDDSCHVYVADTFNSRIQKFTCEGDFLLKWGQFGDGNGSFGQPRGIAVDDSFHVFVSDESLTRKRVQKFDSMGTYLLQWGEPGTGPGQFNSPRELAVDANYFVYVLDSFPNQRVQKFTTMGDYVTEWAGFTSPRGIGIGYPDTVYVADEGHRVQKFNSTGTLLDAWGTFCDLPNGTGCVDPDGGGPLEAGDGQFNLPHGVAIRGNWIYVVDRGNNRIEAFLYSSAIGVPEDDLGAVTGPLGVYPNPSASIVHFTLPLAAPPGASGGEFTVRAQIFDPAGRLVQVLYSGSLPAGEHRFQWDGRTREGTQAGPGIYYAQVVVNGTSVRSTKLVRLR